MLKHVLEKFALLDVDEVLIYTTPMVTYLAEHLLLALHMCRELSMRAMVIAPGHVLDRKQILDVFIRHRDNAALLLVTGGPCPELHSVHYSALSDFYIGYPHFAEVISALKMTGLTVGIYVPYTERLLEEDNLIKLRTLVTSLQLDLVYIDKPRCTTPVATCEVNKLGERLGCRLVLDCSLIDGMCLARSGENLCVWPNGDVSICVKTRDSVCKVSRDARDLIQCVIARATRNPCGK